MNVIWPGIEVQNVIRADLPVDTGEVLGDLAGFIDPVRVVSVDDGDPNVTEPLRLE